MEMNNSEMFQIVFKMLHVFQADFKFLHLLLDLSVESALNTLCSKSLCPNGSNKI